LERGQTHATASTTDMEDNSTNHTPSGAQPSIRALTARGPGLGSGGSSRLPCEVEHPILGRA